MEKKRTNNVLLLSLLTVILCTTAKISACQPSPKDMIRRTSHFPLNNQPPNYFGNQKCCPYDSGYEKAAARSTKSRFSILDIISKIISSIKMNPHLGHPTIFDQKKYQKKFEELCQQEKEKWKKLTYPRLKRRS